MGSFLNLTENVNMSIKNNYPVKIVEKTEQSVISIVTAPVRGDDDGDNVASGNQVQQDEEVAPEVTQTE